MLQITGQRIDPQLVVFDKDGTLIAFDRIWRTWFDLIMEAIASEIDLDERTRLGLAGTLGYDPATGEWDPLGPLTLASTKEIALLEASQLYRYQGKTWDEALAIVDRAERIARTRLSIEDLITPIGDVRGALQRLKRHGILLALATTDDRAQTEQMLLKLELASLFATTVCGDDGFANKPAPDMALEICRRLGIAPERAIMIGDTIADMTMARQAGYAYAIAVTSGALSRQALAPHADLVIPDIHAIEIVSAHASGGQ